jgi:L,D-transpeptidase ErfK/SrfK
MIARCALPRLLVSGMLIAAPAAARATEFTLAPGQTMLGAVQTYTTKASDTLIDLQRPYDVGYAELAAANQGVNPWLPGQGTSIVVPTAYILPAAPHRGIVVNLGERRLYYFHADGKTVETFPIGVGVAGKKTPTGGTTVVAKTKNPAWYPPPSIHAEDPNLPAVVPPGPNNPLGAYALRLGWPNYLIHGTNKPDGVGRNVSHGCLHLYPEDIERLFSEVPIGTPVHVVNQPVLTAWSGGQLYLAVHPSQSQTDEIDLGNAMTPDVPHDLAAKIVAAAGDRSELVDWDKVARAGRERSGIPVAITPPPAFVATPEKRAATSGDAAIETER